MDKTTKLDLEDLQRIYAKTGLDTMTRVFPRKIIELQKMIDDASRFDSLVLPLSVLPDSSLDKMHSEQALKRRRLSENTYLTPAETGPYNLPGLLKSYFRCLKSECETLVQHTDQVLVWLVSTHRNSSKKLESREVFLSELHRAQEAGINMHQMIGEKYLSRAELSSKINEHRDIEDYVLALQEHDEHQFLLVRQNLRDLRNIYMSLYNIVKSIIG